MSSTLSPRDQALLEDFNSCFGTTVTDFKVVSKLLGQPHVRPWYQQWSKSFSARSQLPSQFEAAGLSPEDWEASQAIRAERSKIRSTHSDAVERVSQQYKRKLAELEQALKVKLEEKFDPISVVTEINYNDLTLKDAIYVESAPDAAERERRLSVRVAITRSVLLSLLKSREYSPPSSVPIGGKVLQVNRKDVSNETSTAEEVAHMLIQKYAADLTRAGVDVSTLQLLISPSSSSPPSSSSSSLSSSSSSTFLQSSSSDEKHPEADPFSVDVSFDSEAGEE